MRLPLRTRIALIAALLVLANAAAWAWALLLFRDHPILLGTALLAYGLGLRHGVDADHIAAIDNATRKLVGDGQRPVATGLWFALGHASVVLLAAAGVALATTALRDSVEAYRPLVSLAGAIFSSAILLGIALANLVILLPIWRTWRRARRSPHLDKPDLTLPSGLLGRLLRPLLRVVTASWHLFPIGFLFGLGFDTATEIALLSVSATQAGAGLPIWSIMVFPTLFTAGMALVDTADGLLMLGAYRWAVVDPARKLAYNLSITALSVATALIIGGIEAVGLIGEQLGRSGWFWDAIDGLLAHLSFTGIIIVTVCALAWLLSATAARLRRRPLATEP